MKADIAVSSDDMASIRRMLKNYKQALEDLDDGPRGAELGVHDNLVEDEKGRVDTMLKKLDVIPELRPL